MKLDGFGGRAIQKLRNVESLCAKTSRIDDYIRVTIGTKEQMGELVQGCKGSFGYRNYGYSDIVVNKVNRTPVYLSSLNY